MGNYSFTNHVEVPAGTPIGIRVPTVLEALGAELGSGARLTYEAGCAVRADLEAPADAAAGIAAAVAAARTADVAVAVVGDRAGLFGRGTVGEGSDTDLLVLPGRQGELIDAVLDSGTPTVVVLRDRTPLPARALGVEGRRRLAGVLPGRGGRGSYRRRALRPS